MVRIWYIINCTISSYSTLILFNVLFCMHVFLFFCSLLFYLLFYSLYLIKSWCNTFSRHRASSSLSYLSLGQQSLAFFSILSYITGPISKQYQIAMILSLLSSIALVSGLMVVRARNPTLRLITTCIICCTVQTHHETMQYLVG